MTTTFKRITAEETYDLRHRILRPNQTVADCAYPLDHATGSCHIGCFLDEELVGIGTVLREGQDGEQGANIWRIRGMAVLETARGHGIGGQILQRLIAHAAQETTPGEIWCNGRVHVKGFYERYGFAQIGDVFELPMIGPHIVMSRALQSDDRELAVL
jgi:predicted GNAT family N-acyltransferase